MTETPAPDRDPAPANRSAAPGERGPERDASGPIAGGREETSESLLRRMRGGRRGWIRLAIFAVVTAGIFYLLFQRIDYGQVWTTLRSADPALVAAAGAVTILFPILSALRWRRMLRALGYEIPFRDCFDMVMAAWPMGTITPSKSGDLMKAWYLKDRVAVGLVVGSVLAERVVDVLVLLGLALVGCVLFEEWSLAALAGAGLVGGLGAIALLLRARLPLPPKLAAKLEPMLRSLRLIAGSPTLLAAVVAYTVANWLASVLQVVVAYRALGTPVPLLFAAGALPLAIFVGLLPITLSGMGTRDSAIIVLFARYAAADVSLGVGILYSLFGYWLPALVGLPFLHRVMPKGDRAAARAAS